MCSPEPWPSSCRAWICTEALLPTCRRGACIRNPIAAGSKTVMQHVCFALLVWLDRRNSCITFFFCRSDVVPACVGMRYALVLLGCNFLAQIGSLRLGHSPWWLVSRIPQFSGH